MNDNWLRVPTADVLYACDVGWWRVHIDAIRASGFAGELWTQSQPEYAARCKREAARHADAAAMGLQFVLMERGARAPDIERATITDGMNGGFQALGLSILFGGRKIPLVGYDANGSAHWFGKHPKGLANGDARHNIKHFDAAAPALNAMADIINCSPVSNLTCFRFEDLAAALA